MTSLAKSRTAANLRAALSRECQSQVRYLYFARRADVEGHPELAALFRSAAEGEASHAGRLLELLCSAGDPLTGLPVGTTAANLRAAIQGETYTYTETYPGFARVARAEGLESVAVWFETLARAEKSHAERFSRAAASLAPG